jgi:Xaa-Pro aminopeptidase
MSDPDRSAIWPTPSPARAFVERRQRLAARISGPGLFVAGHARPRNYLANRFAYRAESHFLYLVGVPIEGAALLVTPDRVTLYAPEPDPEEELWTGAMPALDELESRLELETRPIGELSAPPATAALPPQDRETANWLEELLDRPIDAGGGPELGGADAALADAMIELRLHHDAAAVEQLRLAAAVTARAHQAGMARTRPGIREAQVRAAMEAAIVESNMTTSYGSIVTVRGEILHNERYDGLLESGDLLLADVGAETPEGWAGDVTRTWPVSGKASAAQRALYEVVLAAQRAAIDAVRPGVRFRDVHRVAGQRMVQGLSELGILEGDVEDLCARGAAGLFFPHGIGHLLGLDVHDMEDLGDRAGYAPGRERATSRADRYLRLDRDLEPSMAVTIEPGYYRIPGLLEDRDALGDLADAINRAELAHFDDVRGIRIEDDVLVTEDGNEVLTRAIPKDLDDVERAVGG